MGTKGFIIEREDNVVAWVLLGNLELDEVIRSVESIQEAVSSAKREHDSIRIIVDNFELAQDSNTPAFTKEVQEKWAELQRWFVANLNDSDRIAVIHGGATVRMQMSRLSESMGLSKIEQHLFIRTYDETKAAAYEYLGITSNQLIDNRMRLIRG